MQLIVKRHAEEVMAAGKYIEIIDLLLYAHCKGVSLQMYMNTETPIQKGKAAMDFIQDIFNMADSDLATGPMQMEWSVILTRADFKPSSVPWDMNHWIPVLPAGKLTLKDLIKSMHRAEKDERDSLYAILESDSQPDTAEAHTSVMDCLTQLREKALYLTRLATRVHKECGLLPLPVAADGNCGLWSIHELQRFSDGMPVEFLLERDPLGLTCATETGNPLGWQTMLSIRCALSEMWRAVAADPSSPNSKAWLGLFKMMVLDAGGAPIATVTGASGAATSAESTSSHIQNGPASENQPGLPSAENQPGLPSAPSKQNEQAHPAKIKLEKVKQEPSTPKKRLAAQQMFEEYSPPMIKTARHAARAGIVHDRLVAGPSVPLRGNLPDIMKPDKPQARLVWRGVKG